MMALGEMRTPNTSGSATALHHLLHPRLSLRPRRQSPRIIDPHEASRHSKLTGFLIQVGLRAENIMITHPESSAYRPSLSHASSTASASSPIPEPWPRSSSSAVPAPPPATTARPAPSVFRHPSTHSTHSTSSSITSHPPAHPIPFDLHPATSSAVITPSASPPSTTTRTKRTAPDSPAILLRNLGHVVEIAKEDSQQHASRRTRNSAVYEDRRRYEISSMPVGDVIEMVAGLLTKITATNDQQHLHRNIPPVDCAAAMSTTTNSVLAFHGKNVPSITIMSYLSRIHKYCPTTYEVFLSLLVYFDRMTDRVNKKNMIPGSGAVGTVTKGDQGPPIEDPAPAPDPAYNPSHVFVVDSFNIHRLVIAGVTCASKFFSDVFYTNSRYAKVPLLLPPPHLTTNQPRIQVGGLPLAELNHLELQFLILNDFRLSVPVEELEAYGTMLVQFYAREAIANANLQAVPSSQQQQQQQQQVAQA